MGWFLAKKDGSAAFPMASGLRIAALFALLCLPLAAGAEDEMEGQPPGKNLPTART